MDPQRVERPFLEPAAQPVVKGPKERESVGTAESGQELVSVSFQQWNVPGDMAAEPLVNMIPDR